MEEKNKSITIYGKAVKLFKEDLDKIILILDQAGIQNIKIETQSYVYPSNELDNIGKEEIIEKIFATHPKFFSLSFNSLEFYKYRISIDDNSLESEGLMTKIVNILNKRKRNLLTFLSNTNYISIHFIILFIVLIFNNNSDIYKIIFYLYVALILIHLLISVFVILFRNKYKPVLLINKSELPNFWKKNKDSLIINLIVSAFSIFLGLLIGKFLK